MSNKYVLSIFLVFICDINHMAGIFLPNHDNFMDNNSFDIGKLFNIPSR